MTTKLSVQQEADDAAKATLLHIKADPAKESTMTKLQGKIGGVTIKAKCSECVHPCTLEAGASIGKFGPMSCPFTVRTANFVIIDADPAKATGEREWPTMEKYLREAINKNIIDFALRAQRTEDDRIVFYIHPLGVDGETSDFELHGNTLEHNRDIQETK